MRVKIFAKQGSFFRRYSTSSSELQREMNAWLEVNPGVRIIDIKQTSAGGSLEPSQTMISVWYEREG